MLILFQAEFYKIIKSLGFKIAFLGILFLSLFHIVYEYSYFSQYEFFYEGYKKEYVKEIEASKEFLTDPTSHHYLKDHIKELKREIENRKHYLEFYTTHKVSPLKKDFSQGLSKSIFNYEEFLFLILLFCCNSVCYEKSKNITAFQFSSKASRGELYFSKFLGLSLAVTIIFVVNILFSYILSGFLMGFSDLSGQIQSLRGYSFAPIERSIKEFLILKVIFG
ncbi:ABC transporter permease [Inediibacterium massiliense]|uniref:ABC transporter permease n=1 Tax=Inediibacterium massiliense TaxID=1658111 RepID=UPI0006B69916|nr:ABC transporter permease [Inediibacterium massiliense]